MSGFVFPEFGTDKPTYVSARDVLPRLIGISRSRAKEYRNHLCPPGMELGTCTPFVPETLLGILDYRKFLFMKHLVMKL
jgi:hypothetical protein